MNTLPISFVRRVTGSMLFCLVATVGYAAGDGAMSWEGARQQLVTKGEPIYLEELVPPMIPDDQNFFATPFWKAVAQGDKETANKVASLGALKFREGPVVRRIFTKADAPTVLATVAQRLQANGFRPQRVGMKPAEIVLQAAAPGDGVIRELAMEASRSGGRFLVTYEKLFEADGPHWPVLLTVGQFLQVRAQAYMESGDASRAAEDILLILRLAEALRSEPLLISCLLRQQLVLMGVAAFWDCNDKGVWTEEDLAKMQSALTDPIRMDDLVTSLRTERGNFNQWMRGEPSVEERIRVIKAGIPDADDEKLKIVAAFPYDRMLKDQAVFNLSIQSMIDEIQAGHINGIVRAAWGADAKSADGQPLLYTPLMMIHLKPQASRAINVQNQVKLADTACAVERYRLKNRTVPPALTSLIPEYMAKMPEDLLTKGPIQYRPMSRNGYVLSVSAMPKADDSWRPPDGRWSLTRKP